MRQRLWKIARRLLLLLTLLYLILWFFPQPLFAHSTRYNNLVLYSRSTLPENSGDILKTTDRLLSSSELYSTNHTRRVFICDSYALYCLLSFGQRHSFGCSFATTSKNVFIPKADVANDAVLQEKWNSNDIRKRTLSAIITHEITHVMTAEYLGRIQYWKLRRNASWVDEGYADYLARSSSDDLTNGVRTILNPPRATSRLSYFRSRLLVAQLLNDQHLSIKTLLHNPPEEQNLTAELVEKLKKNPVIAPASIEPNP